MGELTKTHRVTFLYPNADPVSLDLDEIAKQAGFKSWEELPEAFQRFFKKFDRDRNGELTVGLSGPKSTRKQPIEVDSYHRDDFVKAFQSIVGDSPKPDRVQATAQARDRFAQAIQGQVQARLIPQIVRDPENLKQWEEARLTLKSVADFEGLCRLAKDLEAKAEAVGGIAGRKFFLLAEACFKEAAVLASEQARGRNQKVALEVNGVKQELSWTDAVMVNLQQIEDKIGHSLTFVYPGVKPVTIDLEAAARQVHLATGLPLAFREVFKELDKDQDRDLVIGPTLVLKDPVAVGSEKKPVEVGDLNRFRFFRIFAALLGDNPYPDANLNNRTAGAREQLGQQIQDAVKKQLLSQIVKDENNPDQWAVAELFFTTLADFQNLYRLAVKLKSVWEKNHDRRLLTLAHDCLEEAARHAQLQPEGRNDQIMAPDEQGKLKSVPWYQAIPMFRHQVGDELDKLDRTDFDRRRKYPMLLRAPALPYEVRHLKAGKEIVLRVSIPGDFKGDLVDFYQPRDGNPPPLVIRPSKRRGHESSQAPIPLIPVRAGVTGDLLNGTYYDETLVDQTLYAGETGRRNDLVAFRLPPGVDIDALTKKGSQRVYDVVVNYPSYVSDAGRVEHDSEVIEKGLVIQDLWDETVRHNVAGDGHMDQRSQRLLGDTLEVHDRLKRAFDRGGPLYDLSPEVALQVAASAYPFIDPKVRFRDRLKYGFYAMNGNVEVMEDLWNEGRDGGKGAVRDYHVGDVDDYNNEDPAETGIVDYRRTNVVPIVRHIVTKSDVPTNITLGNHGPHVGGFALEHRRQNFYDREVFAHIKYADWRQFGTLNPVEMMRHTLDTLEVRKMKGSPLASKIKQLKKPDAERYDLRYDALGPYWQRVNTAEMTVVRDNRGAATVDVESGIEDFLGLDFLENRARAPKLVSLNNGRKTYIDGREANLNGPKPKTAAQLVLTVAEGAVREGIVLNLNQHGAILHGGMGPDGTPYGMDTYRGPVAKFFRALLFSWDYDLLRENQMLDELYHPSPNRGEVKQEDLHGPVIPLVIGEHLHGTEGYFLKFMFKSPEDRGKAFREIHDIWRQAKVDPYHIVYQGKTMNVYEAVERWWEKHKLSTLDGNNQNHMQVRHGRTFQESLAMMKEFNRDNQASYAKNGVLVVNGPAAGHPTAGWLKVSISPEGRYTILPHSLVVLPTGQVLDGENQDDLERKRKHQSDIWMASIGFGKDPEKEQKLAQQFPVKGLVEPEAKVPDFENADGIDREPRVDAPLVVCPEGWVCLNVGGGVGMRTRFHDGTVDFGWGLVGTPAQIVVPFIRDANPGEPRSIYAAVDYDKDYGWMGRAGLGWRDYRGFFHTNFKDVFGFTLELKRFDLEGFPPFGNIAIQAMYRLISENHPVEQAYMITWDFPLSVFAVKVWGLHSDY